MKKILIILIALSSCGVKKNMLVIQEKKPNGEPGMCEYWFNRPGVGPFKLFPQYSYGIDSCNKYEVGDRFGIENKK